MMQKIEEDKPEGWGLNKINADNVDQNNIMDIYAKNMQKALKKLELQSKIEQMRGDKKDVAHAMENEETDRKHQMQLHREKLVAARNAQRQTELMNTTMQKLTIEENKAEEIKQGEIEKQKVELDRRQSIRSEKKKMGQTGMSFAVLKDNYNGNDAEGKDMEEKIEPKKEGEFEKKEEKEEDKDAFILNDDFMNDLKMVDVPDSDDECYL